MKLDTATLAYIENVVETASLVHIDNIIIETGRVRGMDDERSVVMIQNTNVPNFPFKSIGFNRLGVFSSRYEIAKSCDNLEVEATQDDKSEFVRSLTMKGKGTKIDYRCPNPATLQTIPKSINDPVKYGVKMTPEAVLLITRGVSAMSADEITLIGGKDGVSFQMEDINKDNFTYKFADSIRVDNDGDAVNFAHRYPIKNLLVLLKQRPDQYFDITSRGVIKINVNNLDLYIPPRV